MGTAGAEIALEEFEQSPSGEVQYLPPVIDSGHENARVSDGAVDDPLTRLRADLQRLRESVDAIDRRDAAQHGGVKGEIAHLVRRIARLEAIPRPRPVR